MWLKHPAVLCMTGSQFEEAARLRSSVSKRFHCSKVLDPFAKMGVNSLVSMPSQGAVNVSPAWKVRISVRQIDQERSQLRSWVSDPFWIVVRNQTVSVETLESLS